jgi:hypothetical protein
VTRCIGKIVFLTFYAYIECRKQSLNAILASVLVWMWPYYSSHKLDDVIMHVVTVGILFRWFPLISDEFWYETSYIGKIISLSFYAYVEHQKWSPGVILVSILVWMWPCHNSHKHDDIIMPVATMSILFLWFMLIPDEFLHQTSCIRNVISLTLCAYVEHPKGSPDAILPSFFSMNMIMS